MSIVVGDKIKLKSKEQLDSEGLPYVDQAVECLGREFIVKEVNTQTSVVFYVLDGCEFITTEEYVDKGEGA